MSELGDRIKNARTEKGWKQKHLAAELEVEPITVSRWERGATTPDLSVLRQVAEATEKPLGFFVGSAEPASSPEGLEQVVRRLEAVAGRIEAALGRLERLR